MTTLRMPLALVLALTIVFALAGCHRRARVPRYGGTVEAAWSPEEALHRAASTALNCADVALTPIATGIVEARGCGNLRELVAGDVRSSFWLPLPAARTTASADLHCSATSVVVAAPSARTRVVEGCGQRLRYDLVCTGSGGCTWTRGLVSAGMEQVAVAPTREAPVVPTPTPTPVVVRPAPMPPTIAPSAQITARIDAAQRALHRCAWGHFAVHAAWTSTGEVRYSLAPPLAGTSAEECVQTALGDERVYASEAGTLERDVR